MILPVRELLTSQFDEGQWHAKYPSGLKTLCGRGVHQQIGRRYAPTCPDCVANARAWHAIDSSAPPHWGYRRVFKRAA